MTTTLRRRVSAVFSLLLFMQMAAFTPWIHACCMELGAGDAAHARHEPVGHEAAGHAATEHESLGPSHVATEPSPHDGHGPHHDETADADHGSEVGHASEPGFSWQIDDERVLDVSATNLLGLRFVELRSSGFVSPGQPRALRVQMRAARLPF